MDETKSTSRIENKQRRNDVCSNLLNRSMKEEEEEDLSVLSSFLTRNDIVIRSFVCSFVDVFCSDRFMESNVISSLTQIDESLKRK